MTDPISADEFDAYTDEGTDASDWFAEYDDDSRAGMNAAYAYRVGDYVLTGDDAKRNPIDSGVILVIKGSDDDMKALVCENYFAAVWLEVGLSLESIRADNKCKWFLCRDLMLDEDE